MDKIKTPADKTGGARKGLCQEQGLDERGRNGFITQK